MKMSFQHCNDDEVYYNCLKNCFIEAKQLKVNNNSELVPSSEEEFENLVTLYILLEQLIFIVNIAWKRRWGRYRGMVGMALAAFALALLGLVRWLDGWMDLD